MRSRVGALLRGRCPRCREGRVFAGLVRMHHHCPVCAADFEREQGYFLGAMYFSYAIGLVVVAPPIVALIVARVEPGLVIGVALALLVPAAPLLFRVSRIAWLHFDDHFDPLPTRPAEG